MLSWFERLPDWVLAWLSCLRLLTSLPGTLQRLCACLSHWAGTFWENMPSLPGIRKGGWGRWGEVIALLGIVSGLPDVRVEPWKERSVHSPRECGLWLSLGGFHERGQDWEQTQKIYNCHVLLNRKGETSQLSSLPPPRLFSLNQDSPESCLLFPPPSQGLLLPRRLLERQHPLFLLPLILGSVVTTYRKTHLCDVQVPGQGPMHESNSTMPGPSLTSPVSTPAGKVGAVKGEGEEPEGGDRNSEHSRR